MVRKMITDDLTRAFKLFGNYRLVISMMMYVRYYCVGIHERLLVWSTSLIERLTYLISGSEDGTAKVQNSNRFN